MLLVTTALEETWGIDEEILFLGEWCKLYGRKNVWQARIYKTLAYSWDDRELLKKDYAYLTSLYERVLPQLAAALNGVHGTSHSEKYWRVVVGPWLGFFIQMLFQRWSSIQTATRSFPLEGTILLQDEKLHMVPNDMLEFAAMFSGDGWNHYIFGRIILYQTQITCKHLKLGKVDNIALMVEKQPLFRRLKQYLLDATNICLSPFTSPSDMFFIATGMPRAKELLLKIQFKQAPQYSLSDGPARVELDPQRRAWHIKGESQSEFESFIRQMVPQQIPKSHVEGYSLTKDLIELKLWPRFPSLIFTSVGHVYDDLVKTYIASKVEQGSLLVVGQHGGGPFHAINFQTEHELKICDQYLSPGEGNTWHPKVRNVGQLFARRWHTDQSAGGLLVQLGTPRYSFSISTTTQSDDFNIYLNEQMRFVQSLPEPIRKDFSVRLTSTNNLWGNRERWEDKFPDLEVDGGAADIHSLFSKAKVIICTYAGTTYNQTLAANAPTVIFWNRRYEQLHESADLIFDELIRVGIFHETPESAAAHIVSIWNDVDGWWLRADVQDVRERYCRAYAYLPDDPLRHLESALRDVMANRLLSV